jgi:branched-chain amino acid transport system permease protein
MNAAVIAEESSGRLRGLLWGGAAALLILLPLLFRHNGQFSNFPLSVLSQMGIMIIFALSYNMLLGQSGMLSFGHAVYSGMGAFISIHALNLISKGSLPFPVTLVPLIGGLAGLLCGVVFGYVSTKRAGTTFAMISLGIGELVAASSLMLPGFFGGEAGVSGNRTTSKGWFGITYGTQIEMYYLIAVWMLLSAFAMYAITRTPLGRMMNAVRDNPERAEFVGYNTQRVRYYAMILAGFFAGIAGGLSAINYEIVTADAVGALRSGAVLLAAFIGGMGQFFGPIIGAVLMTFLDLMLSGITKAWQFYFGLFFLAMVLYAPGGISGMIVLHKPVWKAGLMRWLAVPYAALLAGALVVFAGLVGLIELTYRRFAETESVMKLFGKSIDSASLVPWLVAVALIAIGCAIYRPAWRRVMQVWGQLLAALRNEVDHA